MLRPLTAADPRLAPLFNFLYALGLPRHTTSLRLTAQGPAEVVRIDCTFEAAAEDGGPILREGAILTRSASFVLAELPGTEVAPVAEEVRPFSRASVLEAIDSRIRMCRNPEFWDVENDAGNRENELQALREEIFGGRLP